MVIYINSEYKNNNVNELPVVLREEIYGVLWSTLEKRRDSPVVFSKIMGRYLTGNVSCLDEIMDIQYIPT